MVIEVASSTVVSSGMAFSRDIKVREGAYERLRQKMDTLPLDTREALKDFVPEGDEFQLKVVAAPEETIRLVAPAGSGKTQTVVHRVLARIRDGMRPERILVLTFDRSAAAALRDKYDKEVARLGIAERVKGVTISTLNAFGWTVILGQHFPAEKKDIIDDRRRVPLYRQVKKELLEASAEHHASLPTSLRDVAMLDVFSRLKNAAFDPRDCDAQALADFLQEDTDLAALLFENVSDDAGMVLVLQAIDWLFRRFDERMREDQVMDYDDQKLRAYRCLQAEPGVLGAVHRRLSEVIVDEFQDINRLDFEFVRAIAAKATLVVTGDDDQAIYGFRGCSPRYIIELEKYLERAIGPYELQRNYRCPPNVVEHANKLISHNTWRIKKQPIAMLTQPSQIRVIDSLGAGLEARWLVDLIKDLRHADPLIRYRDIAVLYRTNAQSLPPQVEFILNDIPYSVRDRDNILDNEVLERLLGVLRVKLAVARGAPPASRDLRLAMRAYYRNLSNETERQLEVLFGTRDRRDVMEILNSPSLAQVLDRKYTSHLPTAFADMLAAPKLLGTLEVLASKFHGLRGMIGTLDEVADDCAPLGEIYEVATNFNDDVQSFVETIEKAMVRARQANAGHDEGGVALLTYFRAKGRQWHTVVLIGCNEGLIPHKRALTDPMKLEEERRLFYVGFTRASANLVISYVRNVVKTSVVASRFIREAGLATD